MRILFLSDVHFGDENIPDESQKFLNAIELLEQEIKNGAVRFDFIVVSGDIIEGRGSMSFKAKYEIASEHVRLLIPLLFDKDVNRIIFCPGNHDILRETANQVYKKILKKCKDQNFKGLLGEFLLEKGDGLLSTLVTMGDPHAILSSFNEFQSFCVNIGQDPLTSEFLKVEDNYLFGFRFQFEEAIILVLNSSWFCVEAYDNKKLILGNALVSKLLDSIPDKAQDSRVRICVMHHDIASLKDDQVYRYKGIQHTDSPSFALIKEEFDLILNGHRHGMLDFPTSYHRKDGALINISAGSFQESDSVELESKENFVVLELNSTSLTKRTGYRYGKDGYPGQGRYKKWKENDEDAHGILHFREKKNSNELFETTLTDDFGSKILKWYVKESRIKFNRNNVIETPHYYAYKAGQSRCLVFVRQTRLFELKNFADLKSMNNKIISFVIWNDSKNQAFSISMVEEVLKNKLKNLNDSSFNFFILDLSKKGLFKFIESHYN